MALSAVGRNEQAILARVEATAALLERRGYALTPARLGEVCLGGPICGPDVLAAMSGSRELSLRAGLVVTPGLAPAVDRIAARARRHAVGATMTLPLAVGFVSTLVRLSPYILAVAVAGSLASGGFAAADDVDLNLVVEDGRRHLAYAAVNALGLLHALRHRGKPVDTHTRRPLAPRFMTANLVLERSQCFPLARQDAAMAYELLSSRAVHGAAVWSQVVRANPALVEHFPQLRGRFEGAHEVVSPRLPRWLFPAALDHPARAIGRAGWRWMQWTRRKRPEALARVRFVRETMRPYALFDEGS